MVKTGNEGMNQYEDKLKASMENKATKILSKRYFEYYFYKKDFLI